MDGTPSVTADAVTAPSMREPLAKRKSFSPCQSLPLRGRWHRAAMTEGVYFYTYVPYFIRKRSIMQVFSLFFQDDAGQRGGFGPVGKITHQNGKTFERKCPEIFQHRLLFIRADDLPALEDGAHHAAGAHGFQSRLQGGDAALRGGEHCVVGPGQPAKVEHHRICRAGLHNL